MSCGQTSIPRQWLVVDHRLGDDLWPAVSRLPRGSGILLVVGGSVDSDRRRLKRRLTETARRKGLVLADEAEGDAVRVHNARELCRALGRHIPLLLLSPIHATRSHPGQEPLPRMRAATLVRLSTRPVLALGGMDSRRFRHVESLGFVGWAGIDSWRREVR